MSGTPLHSQWDIVIAGAGFSGLVAANIAAKGGLKVLVLERNGEPGGCAAISGGIIWAPESAETLAEYVPDGDPDLQRSYCEHFGEAVSWLQSLDLPVSQIEQLGSLGRGCVMTTGQSGDRHQFMSLMARGAEAHGATISYKSSFDRASKHPAGYSIHTEGEWRLPVHAQAILFATGGFQGSPELLDRFVGSGAGKSLFLRSVPECTGTGLSVALDLGGATSRNMHHIYGHTMPDVAIAAADMQPLTAYLAAKSLIINREGERFVDESEGRLEEVILESGWCQPDGCYFLIFDSETYRKYGVDTGISSALPKFDRKARWRAIGASVIEAVTLQSLVETLGHREHVNSVRALRTILSYNLACRNQATRELSPPRNHDPIPLVEPPYFAVRARGGISATCGGIRIDTECHVLGNSGETVSGLYAAGVDAGGVFGKTYGGFLGWSLVSGYLAGRSILRDLHTG